MLSFSCLLEDDGVALFDVTCRHGEGRGEQAESVAAHTLVLVRRGCFVRSTDVNESVLDPTQAYFANPGQVQRFDHPHDGGDDCTALMFDAELLSKLWGGDPALPSWTIRTSPELDLDHRRLLARARRGGEPHELTEGAIALGTRLLERVDRRRDGSGRPASGRQRLALVADVRERLADDPDRSLLELARDLSVSPHHLSRIFRAETGHTIGRHRMRLRARTALERLAGGERDLARLAAELGFSDQSHLSRVLRSETGETPASLRRELAA